MALSEEGGTAWVGGGRGKHCDVCKTTLEAHKYNTEYESMTVYLYMGGQLGSIDSHYSVLKAKFKSEHLD